jgi:hypothetical protein
MPGLLDYEIFRQEKVSSIKKAYQKSINLQSIGLVSKNSASKNLKNEYNFQRILRGETPSRPENPGSGTQTG